MHWGAMRLPFNEDFSDLFSALNDSRARYLLVGGYAMAVHGEPRATKDIDVWYLLVASIC